MSFVDHPAESVFRSLAAAAGRSVEFRDGVVSFPAKGEGSGSLLLVYPGYEDPEEVADVLSSVLEGSRVKRVGGRVAVWARTDDLASVRSVVRALDVGPDGWRLDVRVVGVSASLRDQLGLGLSGTTETDLSLGGSAGSLGGSPLTGAKAVLALKLVGSAVSEGRDARILTDGTLGLVEGSEAELQQGEVIPVPKRTISPEGVVTVTGFDQVKTGFNLKAVGRRVPGGLRLELAPSLSSVAGYVEGNPVVSERSVKGVLIVRSGEWVVLSGLQIKQAARSASGGGIWGGVETESQGLESVLVFVRCVRVHASVSP